MGGTSWLLQVDETGKEMFVGEVQRFAGEHDFGGHRRLVDQALERHAINARFVTGGRPTIAGLLAKA